MPLSFIKQGMTAANPALSAPSDLALYVHWPFCKSKCPYCDFNSHVRDSVNHAAWAAAFVRELKHYRALTGPREIKSVFFGGGTPSLMETSTAATVIETIDALWGLPQGTEITLEANPTSVEAGKLHDFKNAGVNRVSLGVQALRDADLKKLGREHSVKDALAALDTAARIFTRSSFDLIYAREGQTPAMWRDELREALSLAQGHLSMYQLTIEEGTQFHTLFQRGDITIPDEDAGAAMYEITQELTAAAGLPAYEISNHARLGDESRHNLMYWRYRDYAGIGPGAHGRLTLQGAGGGYRKMATRAHRAPEAWLQRVQAQGHGAHPFDEIDAAMRAREALMMGLRLTEGMDTRVIEKETGLARGEYIDMAHAAQLRDGGFLEYDAQGITATAAGRQRLNGLLSYLIKA